MRPARGFPILSSCPKPERTRRRVEGPAVLLSAFSKTLNRCHPERCAQRKVRDLTRLISHHQRQEDHPFRRHISIPRDLGPEEPVFPPLGERVPHMRRPFSCRESCRVWLVSDESLRTFTSRGSHNGDRWFVRSHSNAPWSDEFYVTIDEALEALNAQ